MRKLIITSICILLCLTACQEQNLQPVEKPLTVRATIENLDTRTALQPEDNMYKVVWMTGDQITVTDGSRSAVYGVSAGGSSVADLEIVSGPTDIFGEGSLAYYPSSLATGSIPAFQTWAEGAVVEVPMAASAITSEMVFHNLCGMIRLDISTALEGVEVDRIVAFADQPISGQFTIYDDRAVITQGNEGVQLRCPAVPLGSTPTSFYINVPADSYTGLVISVFDTRGRAQVIRLKEGAVYTVRRSEVCPITLVANDFETVPLQGAQLRPGQDFNQMVKRLTGTRRTVTDADSVLKRIVFETGSRVSSGLRADAFDSQWPVWINYNEGQRLITVSTPADYFQANKISAFMFAHLESLEAIENLGSLHTDGAIAMNGMFSYCGSRSTTMDMDVSHFNTSSVTTFYQMFYYCKSLRSLDMTGWDTSKGVSFNYMFYSCSSLPVLDLSSFSLASVPDKNGLTYMFSRIPYLREMRLGPAFQMTPSATPSSFFLASSDAVGVRTASMAERLTIHCTAAAANWLCRTNLRWIKSGYKIGAPKDVEFLDLETGEPITVIWGAD